ncbi:MAG: sigma-70 family RNA polymerase sigma factor [Myxococcales bacterium]|nr:sigma-70 family RNA polymerase sigma factor [Myxococcales bacterium]
MNIQGLRLSVTDAAAPPQLRGVPAALLTADFRALYDAGFRHVWLTLRRLGVAERDLEDAAHEVFVVVHRRLADYDPARPLRPWLTGIAWRVAADERRRARHHREQLGVDPATACPAPGPEQAVAAEEARALVHRALQTLDLDRRVVFVMAELDGATAPEIAEALGIPLNTAYSRLRVARQRFADAVRRLRGGEAR